MKAHYKRQKLLVIFLILIMMIVIFLALVFLNVLPDYSKIKGYFYPEFEYLRIKEPVYIMPYIGDIDGEVSEDWVFFYEKITEFHDKNEMPVTFSFYSASIKNEDTDEGSGFYSLPYINHKDFNKIFLRMYESKSIELMQKSYRGDAKEMEMYKLSMEEQKSIIKEGREVFKSKMGKIIDKENKGILNQVLGRKISSNVRVPIAYNQIGGVINNNTKTALIELGFKIYFDMFVAEGHNPVESSEDFDVIEYGVSFTQTGRAGKENMFNSPLKITQEINNFNREDVTVMEVNGRKVIPLWAHQQDFESRDKENKLDKEKWNIYVFTLKELEKDPNVKFITPKELVFMKHKRISL